MSRSALRRTLARFRAAGRLGPRAGLLVGVLAVGIGLLASCDSSISTNRPLAENTAPGDSATVAHAPMPTGTSLPAPGAGPRGTLRSYRAAGARNSKSGAAASPYGCYLASRPYSEEVRFRSVYLYFPDEMVEAAGEETRPLIFRLGAVRKGRTDTTGVRYANCVIPDADGAEATARRQVIRKGEEQAVTEAVQSAGRAAGAKSDCTDIVKVVEYCDYGGCSVVSVEVTVACGGGAMEEVMGAATGEVEEDRGEQPILIQMTIGPAGEAEKTIAAGAPAKSARRSIRSRGRSASRKIRSR